jgi:hypothetical protein
MLSNQKSNSVKFGRVLQWKMLVYFIDICLFYCHMIYVCHLVYFVVSLYIVFIFGVLHQGKSGNPECLFWRAPTNKIKRKVWRKGEGLIINVSSGKKTFQISKFCSRLSDFCLENQFCKFCSSDPGWPDSAIFRPKGLLFALNTTNTSSPHSHFVQWSSQCISLDKKLVGLQFFHKLIWSPCSAT